MSDASGLPSALGIEAVEWVAQEGAGFTVRVQGRWRRRRAGAGGQALLVIEAHGMRHRFPAMPEPPGVGGAAPGTWQLSFSVAAQFGPPHAARAWLQIGAVVVPLVVPDGADTGSGGEMVAGLLAAPERLRVQLAERARELRLAEQRAFAERERRLELEQELADSRRTIEALKDDAADVDELEGRIVELEAELQHLRRAADETEHALAAALAARERAERALREQAERVPVAAPEPEVEAAAETAPAVAAAGPADPEVVQAELSLLARSGERLPSTGPRVLRLPGHDGELLRLEGVLALRAQRLPVAPPDRPELPAAAEDRLAATLSALRGELHELRQALEHESAARRAAEERAQELEQQLREHLARSVRAHEAIEILRAEVEAVRDKVERVKPEPSSAVPPTPPAASQPRPVVPESLMPRPVAEAPPPAEVDPHRLDVALSRLREAGPEPVVIEPPVAPWLHAAMRRLVRSDPTAAGELLLALLPAQGMVVRGPFAYDLVLNDTTVLQVTVPPEGPAALDVTQTPRPRGTVSFSLHGELASIARLLVASPLRRRLRAGVARVQGDREAVQTLRELVSVRATVDALHANGVRPHPLLALKVAAAMVDRNVVGSQQFTVAYQRPGATVRGPYLCAVKGSLRAFEELGRPRDAVAGPSASLTCPPDALLLALAGSEMPDVAVEGHARVVELVRDWLTRSQRV